MRFSMSWMHELRNSLTPVRKIIVSKQIRDKIDELEFYLKDEIEYRKISQRNLAKQLGISYKVLNDLLNGRRSLTATTAMMLEAALDIPANSLMRLQMKYTMQQARNDNNLMERLRQIRKYASLL